MFFVTSVQYDVLVNNNFVGLIILKRGLRQSDPLSPYLFILCVEGLLALIRKVERSCLIHGVKVCGGAPPVSHLLYVDNSFFFFEASVNECMKMK